jgi:hypothetical protein
MNDKIKELAIEANLISPESNGFDSTRLSISQQKFAELIVQECVDICNLTTDRTYLNGVIAGDKIKKHFGVAE